MGTLRRGRCSAGGSPSAESLLGWEQRASLGPETGLMSLKGNCFFPLRFSGESAAE